VTVLTTDRAACVERSLCADSLKEMTMRRLRLRELLIDEAGAEIVEFAIILASFTIITMSAVSYLGAAAAGQVGNDSNGLSNGALNPP
jgi:Flp pilus assembly pilin Flp